MNNFLAKLLFLAILVSACWGTFAMYKNMTSNDQPYAVSNIIKINHTNPGPTLPLQTYDGQLVQVALLLDVSGSMDGLINQARTELWRVVSSLAEMSSAEEESRLEIALYAYGRSGAAQTIFKLSDFTTDLDVVSEKLYGLQTNGGEEYCGQVIHEALTNLTWKKGKSGGRFICIAGNEPFTQGSFPYEKACSMAMANDIVVNTIYCGDKMTGSMSGWKDGAQVGGGEYFAINHNQNSIIASPYDDEIASYNTRFNDTYYNYTASGSANYTRQSTEDKNNFDANGNAGLADRAKSKMSKFYFNSHWDLVDAVEDGTVNIDSLAVEGTYQWENAPAEIKEKTAKELKAEVAKRKADRDQFRVQIETLTAQRDSFVAVQRASQNAPASLGDALNTSFKKKLKK
ncbi:MAG: VWA domain-containing protein [Bacteroidia bacterium]